MITINDADVKSIGHALDCTFDEPHVRFLKATTACDVHACPGSGKTTLLVAKLALLARQWPSRDRGILVLSHTNVARREVEHRLAKEPSAARLLGYPHFIGTIQGFVDRFLALPYLRDVGVGGVPVDDPHVDDEMFAERASRVFFRSKQYPQARAWLKHKFDEGRNTVATLFYGGPDGAVLMTQSGTIPKPETPTARQLRALKDEVAAQGVFRYADMFGFAAASLKARPFLRDALRARFPWVFVDEMQDTSADQEALLNDLFRAPTVVFTKVGDVNQAIFSETADVVQPVLRWAQAIEFPSSQRLAPKLAKLVSPLAVVHPLELEGNVNRRDRQHTFFLFNDDSVRRVLPAFGNVILEEWGSSPPSSFTAKAVGFRRRPPEKAVLPASLVDYWADFAVRPAEQPPLTTLLEAVRHARRLIDLEGGFFAAHRIVSGALARLVELNENKRVTRRILAQRCREGSLDERALQCVMSTLLREDSTSTLDAWAAAVRDVCRVLVVGTLTGETRSYVAWAAASILPTQRGHVFVHKAKSGTVSIEVATIHAVKGETHDATLVVETYLHQQHDVKLAVPLLCGEPRTTLTKRGVEHLKRLFVGATRPKELLCFAIHESHILAAHEQALLSQGWRIQRVT